MSDSAPPQKAPRRAFSLVVPALTKSQRRAFDFLYGPVSTGPRARKKRAATVPKSIELLSAPSEDEEMDKSDKEDVFEIVAKRNMPDGEEDTFLVRLEEGGKRVKRTKTELLLTAPKLLKGYLESVSTASSAFASPQPPGRVAKQRAASKTSSSKETEVVLVDTSDESESEQEELASDEDGASVRGSGEGESDEEESDSDESSGESSDSDSREIRGKKRRVEPSRRSARPIKEIVPNLSVKVFNLENASSDRYSSSEGTTKSKSTRFNTVNEESESDDELAIGSKTAARHAKKMAAKREIVVLSDSDEEDEAPIARGKKWEGGEGKEWEGAGLPQFRHRDKCFKCYQGPAQGLLEKLKAKKKRGGRKRKRHEDEEDTDEERDRIARLGAWMECDVCVTSAHFGCLSDAVRKEFVNARKADDKALQPPPIVDLSAVDIDGPPRAPPPSPRRKRVELDVKRSFVVSKCNFCKKAGGRRCLKCGVSGRKALKYPAEEDNHLETSVAEKDAEKLEVVETSANDGAHMDVNVAPNELAASPKGDDVELSDDSEPPLMFRCVKCKRAAHYPCLVPESDDYTLEEHAESYMGTGYCTQCDSYTHPLDVILAWADEEESAPVDGVSGEDADDFVGDADVIRRKDEKTGKVFVLPSAKDPTCRARYLVKWQGQSYRRLQWVPHAYLAAVYQAKLTNFLANGSRIVFDKPPDDIPEEGEDEAKPQTGSTPVPDPAAQDRIPLAWKTVDRVLDVVYWSKDRKRQVPWTPSMKSEPQEGLLRVAECYIKWSDLPYSSSNWEEPPGPAEAGYHEYVKAYKAFLVASSPAMRVSKLSRQDLAELDKPRDPKKFNPIKEQPPYVGSNGAKLMPFQLDGVNFLFNRWWNRTGCILADEMGLGKTVQIITFLAVLSRGQGARPFLIAVPNSTLGNWVREFGRWAPDLRVVPYGGDKESRHICEKYELFDGDGNLKTHVVICTYEALEKNVSIFRRVTRWDCLVVDEGQRLKGGPGMALYDALQSLTINHRILLSGTPLNNNLRELFSLLHFIVPTKFRNIDELTERYIDLTPEKVEEIRGYLKPYFLRRTKELVLQLPPLHEVVVPVTMTVLQRQLYRNLLENNIGAITSIFQKGGKANSSATKKSFNNILMQLRKLLGHPYLISEHIEPEGTSQEQQFVNLVEASAKLVLLAKLLPKLQAAGHRVLIFSQFKIVLNIIEDFLVGLKMLFLRLDGDTAQLDRQRGIDAFQKEGSEIFAYILSTRAGGVGITLTGADTVIMFDQDFNPHQDIQAISRAHRIGQNKPVRVFKLMTRGTCEERIFNVGNKKLGLDHIIIRRLDAEKDESEEIQSILQYGAREIFDDDLSEKNQLRYTDAQIDSLISRNLDVPASPQKESAASSFAHAKIWEVERDELAPIIVGGDEQEEENLHDFWANILEQEEEKARKAKVAAAAQTLGKRRRTEVKYNFDSPVKAPTKREAGAPATSSEDDFMDDDFRQDEARSDSGSSSAGTPAAFIPDDFALNDPNVNVATAPPKKKKHRGPTPVQPLAEMRQGPPVISNAPPSEATLRRLKKRESSLTKFAVTARQFNCAELDQILSQARSADFESQTALLMQATMVVRKLIETQPLGPKPAVQNGSSFPKPPTTKPQTPQYPMFLEQQQQQYRQPVPGAFPSDLQAANFLPSGASTTNRLSPGVSSHRANAGDVSASGANSSMLANGHDASTPGSASRAPQGQQTVPDGPAAPSYGIYPRH